MSGNTKITGNEQYLGGEMPDIKKGIKNFKDTCALWLF